MKFLFDNNFSPKHVRTLQNYDVEAVALRDEFGADAKDEDYLPGLKDTGYILVTCDLHIQTRRAEARALKESGVSAPGGPRRPPRTAARAVPRAGYRIARATLPPAALLAWHVVRMSRDCVAGLSV